MLYSSFFVAGFDGASDVEPQLDMRHGLVLGFSLVTQTTQTQKLGVNAQAFGCLTPAGKRRVSAL
jgi:hypothetical protein